MRHPALCDDPAPREPIERRLAKLLAAQHGVFTRAQAIEAGATARVIGRRLATRRWEQLQPTVFRISGGASTWRQSLLAACLAWGEVAIASHRAAALLWETAGVERRVLEVTVPRGRRRRGIDGVITHWTPVDAVDRTMLEGIPVTTPARTLIDLASVVSRELLEEALDDALRRRLTRVGDLRRRLEQLGRKPGVATMRALLDGRGRSAGVPESVLETRLLRFLRASRLPEPTLQHEVRVGARRHRIDFAYPAERIAIEAEGYEWHAGRSRWERDLERRNVLTSLGWRILHVTWRDMTHGREQLHRRIQALLKETPL